MFLGIWLSAGSAWFFTDAHPAPTEVLSVPSFAGSFMRCFDFQPFLEEGCVKLWWAVTALLLVALSDVAGVTMGICQRAGLDHHLDKVGKHVFIGCGLSSFAGAISGTCPSIIAAESSAGILEGGKTGLTAVVCGLCFLVASFFVPVFAAIPGFCSAPPLIIVGMFMMAPVGSIQWDNIKEAFPAFMTLVSIPFTYSISNGVVIGVVSSLLIKEVFVPMSGALSVFTGKVNALVFGEKKEGLPPPDGLGMNKKMSLVEVTDAKA